MKITQKVANSLLSENITELPLWKVNDIDLILPQKLRGIRYFCPSLVFIWQPLENTISS